MKTLIINDLHLGVKRQAGTTKKSREALEDWQLREFKKLLLIPHDNLIILGDLFDKRNVEEHVMKRVIKLLTKESCVVIAGNHDLGGCEDHTMSSAEFVTELSGARFVTESMQYMENLWLVPHMHSQDEFDKAVQGCPDDSVMLTHCNIDSPFAHGDHSLNLSLQQIKDLEDRNVDIISGHEHSQRQYHDCTVIGCQIPTSIADCLGRDKRCLILEDGVLTSHITWTANENYYEGNDIPTKHYDFINITGECELSEYPAIVKSVADLRRISDAFIVKNSVKVKEFEADTSAEEITRFNITDMLLEEIHPDYREEVKSCL